MEDFNEITFEDIEAKLNEYGIDLLNEIDKNSELSEFIEKELELINSEILSKETKLDNILTILASKLGYEEICKSQIKTKVKKDYNSELNTKNFKEESKLFFNELKDLKDSQIIKVIFSVKKLKNLTLNEQWHKAIEDSYQLIAPNSDLLTTQLSAGPTYNDVTKFEKQSKSENNPNFLSFFDELEETILNNENNENNVSNINVIDNDKNLIHQTSILNEVIENQADEQISNHLQITNELLCRGDKPYPECFYKLVISLAIEKIKGNIDNIDLETKVQQLYSYENHSSHENNNLFKNFLEKNNINQKDIINTAINLIKSTGPQICILQIKDQVQKGYEYYEKGKDKVCYMLIGLTGAGKSTFTNFILGNKLKCKISGSTKRFDVVNTSDGVMAKIGHGKSETIYVNAINIKLDGTDYMMVDSPGLEDTRSAEIDIGCILGVNKFLQIAKKIILVFIININDVRSIRGEKFEDHIESLSKMFDFTDEDLQSCQFFFTNMVNNPEEINSAKKLLKNYLNNRLNKCKTQSLECLVGIFNKQLSMLESRVLENYDEKELKSVTNILINSTPFKNHVNRINFVIQSKTNEEVIKMSNYLKKNIDFYSRNKEFNKVCYFLNDLRTIIMDFKAGQERDLLDIFETLKNEIKRDFKQAIDEFNLSFQIGQKINTEKIVTLNSMYESEEYLAMIEFYSNTNNERNFEFPTSSLFILNLNNTLKDSTRFVKNENFENSDSGLSNKIYIIYTQMKSLENTHEEFKAEFENYKQLLLEITKTMLDKFESYLQEMNYESGVKLKKKLEILENTLANQIDLKVNEKISDIIITYLNAVVDAKYFEKEDLTKIINENQFDNFLKLLKDKSDRIIGYINHFGASKESKLSYDYISDVLNNLFKTKSQDFQEMDGESKLNKKSQFNYECLEKMSNYFPNFGNDFVKISRRLSKNRKETKKKLKRLIEEDILDNFDKNAFSKEVKNYLTYSNLKEFSDQTIYEEIEEIQETLNNKFSDTKKNMLVYLQELLNDKSNKNIGHYIKGIENLNSILDKKKLLTTDQDDQKLINDQINDIKYFSDKLIEIKNEYDKNIDIILEKNVSVVYELNYKELENILEYLTEIKNSKSYSLNKYNLSEFNNKILEVYKKFLNLGFTFTKDNLNLYSENLTKYDLIIANIENSLAHSEITFKNIYNTLLELIKTDKKYNWFLKSYEVLYDIVEEKEKIFEVDNNQIDLITRVLKKVTTEFTLNKIELQKFKSLRETFDTKIKDCRSALYKKIENHINNNECDEINAYMVEIQKSEELKYKLKQHNQTFIKESENCIEYCDKIDFNTEVSKEDVKKIGSIYNNMKDLEGYFKNSNNKNLNNCLSNIENCLKQKDINLNFDYEKKHYEYNYSTIITFFNKIAIVKKFYTLLTQNSKFEKGLFNDILKICEENKTKINQYFNEKLENDRKNYTTVTDFLKNNLLDEIYPQNPSNPEMYKRVGNLFAEILENEIKSKLVGKNAEKILESFKNEIFSILDGKKPRIIEICISQALSNLKEKKDFALNELNRILESDNINELNDLIKINENNKPVYFSITQVIRNKIYTIKENFDNEYKLSNPSNMISAFKKALIYKEYSADIINNMCKILSNQIEVVISKISEVKGNLLSISNSEIEKNIESFIIYFKDFISDNQASYYTIDLIDFVNSLIKEYETLESLIKKSNLLSEIDGHIVKSEILLIKTLLRLKKESDIFTNCNFSNFKYDENYAINKKRKIINELGNLNFKDFCLRSDKENIEELKTKKKNCLYLKEKYQKEFDIIKLTIEKEIETIKKEIGIENIDENNTNASNQNQISKKISKLKLINDNLSSELQINLSDYFIELGNKIRKMTKNTSKIFKKGEISKENSYEVVNELVTLKMLSLCIGPIDNDLANETDKTIKDSIEKISNNQEVLFIVFKQMEATEIGKSILSENTSLYGNYQKKLFSDKIQKIPEHEVIDKLLKDNKIPYKKDEMLNWLFIYNTEYKLLLEKELTDPKFEIKKNIIDELLKYREETDRSKQLNYWNENNFNELPKLIAKVCALKHLIEKKEICKSKNEKYYWEANTCQILGIMMMLRTNSKNKGDTFFNSSPFKEGRGLINNLCQILTGEGKSILLGVCTTILALTGFQVYCTSYSDNLSSRDYEEFRKVFEALKLQNFINYGTFTNLSESLVCNKLSVREFTDNLINGQVLNNNDTKIFKELTNKRVNVLLIDEVDSFLFDDNIGQPYIPSIALKSKEICAILDYVWANKESLTFSKIISTDVYNNLIKAYSAEFTPLFENMVKSIFNGLDAANKNLRNYEIKDDGKIYYITNDYSSCKISYGFETTFTYYKAFDEKKILKEHLDAVKFFNIKCGKFSNAEIVKEEFQIIMGVSGTLNNLSEKEFNVLKKYNIEKDKFVFVPSIFLDKNHGGRFRFESEKNTCLVGGDQETYYKFLCNKLVELLPQEDSTPIIVVFESYNKLYEFSKSEIFANSNISKLDFLTEMQNNKEKNEVIRSAVSPGKLTLITRSFGRGTDFRSYSYEKRSQGPHVIQTFFSKEISEEIQIKGRTARQNDRGSYELILWKEDLLKYFDANEVDELDKLIKTPSDIYKVLDEKRKILNKKEYDDFTKIANYNNDTHKNSVKFIKEACTKKNKFSENELASYLMDWNKTFDNIASGNCRTMIVFDATGSMGSLFSKLIILLYEVFKRVEKILKDGGKQSLGSLIKIGIYRNYGISVNDIYECSNFSSDPVELNAYISSKTVKGGLGNECVECALQNVNFTHTQTSIDQVVLIGDADANTVEEARDRRGNNESIYKGSLIENPTNYKKELEVLKKNKIIVNSFCMKSYILPTFKEISDQTGGSCNLLNVENDKDIDLMVNVVSKEILKKLGGEVLVQLYNKSYIS